MGEQLIQEPADAVHQRNPPPLLDQAPQDSSMVEPLNFAALRLESSPPATATATISHHHHHHNNHSPFANCGFCGSSSCAGADHSNSSSGSHKRPLPPPSTTSSSSLLFPSYDPQPKPKKLFLDRNDAVLPPTADPPSLPAPAQHSGADPFFLRRCVSDPYHVPPSPASAYQSPPANSFPGSGSGIFSNTCRSPENMVKINTPNSVTPCSAPLPPRPPPTLRRCVSDLTPSPAKSLSRTSSSTDLERTPNSKKLKKMWHCWKEMNSRMEEFMSEEEEQQAEENDNEGTITDHQNDINNATQPQDDSEIEFEESLSVERKGEGLTVRFNCHCGRGYEFLLPEGNCYYKLL